MMEHTWTVEDITRGRLLFYKRDAITKSVIGEQAVSIDPDRRFVYIINNTVSIPYTVDEMVEDLNAHGSLPADIYR